MRKCLFTLFMLLISLLSIQAQETYYVNATTGNDSNSGTSPNDAWATLEGNADTWKDIVSTIYVADGEYLVTNPIVVGSSGRVQIIGTGGKTGAN
jgi:hypothetical protein